MNPMMGGGRVFPPGCGSLLEGDELILSASLMKKWCFLLVVATQILVYVHPYLEEMFNLTSILPVPVSFWPGGVLPSGF